MSRWFRHYAGMMRDEKLVSVAIKSKQPVERVLWVWGAILESAAEIDDDGKYELDPAEVAYFLRADQADIDAVLAALTDAGRLADGVVVKWGNRQFSSDKSNARVAKYRERQRAKGSDGNGKKGNGNADVTLQERDRNAPETETEEDTETPPTPPRGQKRDYAFSGKVCRLTRRDFDDFRKQFHAIPDFKAELVAFDGWAAEQSESKQAKWFGSLAPWLNKRHQEALERAKPRQRDWAFTGPA